MNSDRLSFTGRFWKQRCRDTEKHRYLAQQLKLEPLFAPILAYLDQLVDPLTLLDMEQAITRIIQALTHQEPMAVFGDYDVDGSTSAALLIRYFRALGTELRLYIPNRLTEGYGPNPTAMEKLANEGIRLLITVDCGITAFLSFERAAQCGLDVIITDHHQARQELPKAVAVINPNRLDETFPYKELAGVGVAFFLLMALNRRLRQQGWFTGGKTEPDLRRLLDLVAVGTIADVARLTGPNRPLVAKGLEWMEHSTNSGLKSLLRQASISFPVTTGSIGFHLAPRINAGGRLGLGDLGSTLLTTDDAQTASQIAETLESYNRERQEIEKQIMTEAIFCIESQKLDKKQMGIVLSSQNWHPGVVGIVASRLSERFHRPCIIVALDAEGKGKGSGRSIPGLNLLAAIEASSEHLITFGGHQAAAGVSIKTENLELFSHAFDQAVRSLNPPELFQPTLIVDTLVPHNVELLQIIKNLDKFKPFGAGNPEPVLMLKNLQVSRVWPLKDRHVKCQLTGKNGLNLSAITFRCLPGPLGEALLERPSSLDVVGTLGINEYQNRQTIQFMLKDARPNLS
ncbi:MAG: single-stranded-DNA-specific exonuclease RecJ [Magnetococcus sp. DMHC-6]